MLCRILGYILLYVPIALLALTKLSLLSGSVLLNCFTCVTLKMGKRRNAASVAIVSILFSVSENVCTDCTLFVNMFSFTFRHTIYRSDEAF